MTAMAQDQSQADTNFAEFQKLLPGLLNTHAGKFALMHDRKVVDICDTLADAAKLGNSKFGTGNFSVQEITSKTVNLGFYSYAVHKPAA